MGVMPYISASIMVQMMAMVVPQWMETRKKASPAVTSSPRSRATAPWAWRCSGRFVRRRATPGAGLRHRTGLAIPVRRGRRRCRPPAPCSSCRLGQQITRRAASAAGLSMIILGGVAGIPGAIGTSRSTRSTTARCPASPGWAHRRGARRDRVLRVRGACASAASRSTTREAGRPPRMMAAPSARLPFKINMSGVIPPIFVRACCCSRPPLPASAVDERLPGRARRCRRSPRPSWATAIAPAHRGVHVPDHLLLLLLHHGAGVQRADRGQPTLREFALFIR